MHLQLCDCCECRDRRQRVGKVVSWRGVYLTTQHAASFLQSNKHPQHPPTCRCATPIHTGTVMTVSTTDSPACASVMRLAYWKMPACVVGGRHSTAQHSAKKRDMRRDSKTQKRGQHSVIETELGVPVSRHVVYTCICSCSCCCRCCCQLLHLAAAGASWFEHSSAAYSTTNAADASGA